MKNKEINMVIAIDGPAGSGKGTLASILAEKCNLLNIDTGAIYRSVALAALRNNLKVEDKKEIIELLNTIDIRLDSDGKVYLDNEDVTHLIRSKEVNNIVSPLSNIVEVREKLVEMQRNLAENNSVVMEGRDITTVVFPNADYKFYLDATLDERTRRRFIESQEKGIDITYDEVYENIKARDYNDMNKPVGALIRTNDQIYIDSTNMTIEEVVNKVINLIGCDKK